MNVPGPAEQNTQFPGSTSVLVQPSTRQYQSADRSRSCTASTGFDPSTRTIPSLPLRSLRGCFVRKQGEDRCVDAPVAVAEVPSLDAFTCETGALEARLRRSVPAPHVRPHPPEPACEGLACERTYGTCGQPAAARFGKEPVTDLDHGSHGIEEAQRDAAANRFRCRVVDDVGDED